MNSTERPSNETTLVVGASRGLGRGIAAALAAAGGSVIAVARTASALDELRDTTPVKTEVADAGDPSVAGSLLDRHDRRR